MRRRRAEGERLVEIAEERALDRRKAEFEALTTLFDGVFKSLFALAQVIARRPTL
jgi:hypothetical protein